MSGIRRSRTPFDYIAGTERNGTAERASSLLYTKVQAPRTPIDERMEKVNHLRTAILNGYYRVRTADVAQKLLETMREGSGLRFGEEVGNPTFSPPASVSSTEATRDATFLSPQASESAEEVKHE